MLQMCIFQQECNTFATTLRLIQWHTVIVGIVNENHHWMLVVRIGAYFKLQSVSIVLYTPYIISDLQDNRATHTCCHLLLIISKQYPTSYLPSVWFLPNACCVSMWIIKGNVPPWEENPLLGSTWRRERQNEGVPTVYKVHLIQCTSSGVVWVFWQWCAASWHMYYLHTVEPLWGWKAARCQGGHAAPSPIIANKTAHPVVSWP